MIRIFAPIMSIITTYSPWFIFLCLIAGTAYAALLYYKNKREEFTPLLNTVLFIVRALCVAFISFFLLSPLLKTRNRTTEKPLIIIAQDNSYSLRLNKDSAFYRASYPALINELIEKLETDFEVRKLSFGTDVSESLSFNFDDKLTDISAVFNYLRTTGYSRNTAALILASDGLYNAGVNPLHVSSAIPFGIITLALGDTSPSRDLLVQNINCNKMVYLNNNFPVELNLNARKLDGQKTVLNVTYDGKNVLSQEILITSNNFFKTVPLSIKADKAGKKKLTVTLSPLENEITTENNSLTAYIDVIDSRRKILLLSNAPHPDIGALNAALSSHIGYEIKHHQVNDFSASIEPYNLVILHNLPSQNNPALHIMKQIKESNVPVLFIAGSSISISAFNNAGSGIFITNTKANTFNELLPFLSDNFTLFTLSDASRSLLNRLPPLFSHFGVYNEKIPGEVMLYQKIGTVSTKNPLIYFNDAAGKKRGVIAGEGIWKWRLFDFAQNENHDATNEIFLKIVQYLAVKDERTNFRVSARDIYFENEPLVMEAELYNNSFEPVNTAEVNIVITNAEGKSFNYTFSKTSMAYTLNAGVLPVGDYNYVAQTKLGNNLYKASGSFVIATINKEALSTTADHNLLYNMAARHNGKLYYPNQTELMYNEIVENNDYKPVIYETLTTTDMIARPLLLFLLVFLLAVEWFLRKRAGSY